MARKAQNRAVLQPDVNMTYAYSAKLTYNKQRIKEDGTATLYITIVFERKKKPINLNFSWPVDKIDEENQVLLPRKRSDKECDDLNIFVKRELGKINEIFRTARLGSRKLTIDIILKEYENYASKDDFIAYAFTQIEERINTGIIRASTGKTHKNSIATLTAFKKKIPFSDINVKLFESYKAFMYNKMNYDSDTAHTKLKNIRTYLNLARKDGFIFEYPFGDFKMPKTEARIEFLKEDEVQLLKRFFRSGYLTPGTNKEKSLRAFLFICYTGLRVSDIYSLTHRDLKNETLGFVPRKNTADNQLEVVIPLHPEAVSLINTKKGPLFIMPPEAKFRESLHWIRNHLQIKSKISPHIGRHTFATRFLNAGGRLEVLQKLLGHTDIKTTMIYVHVTLQDKVDQVNLLD
ncbi:MAG: site-specific integrase [Cytophagales bacterium]|nr:site-specific integrase [Cytophagales bacterium]